MTNPEEPPPGFHGAETDNAPKAEAVGIEKPLKKRRFGALRGLITIDQRFFDPLPESELADWE